MQFNLFSVPIILGIGFLSFLMYLASQRNRGRIVTIFMIFSGLVLLYGLLFSAYLLSASNTLQALFFHLMVFCTVFIPPMILFFIMEYLGYDSWVNWKSISIFLFIPAVAGVLELTNPLHGLFWVEINFISHQGFTYIKESPGLIPLLLTTYLYFVLGISMALLFWGIFHIPRQHRRELSVLVLALAIPLIFDFLRTFHLNPWPYLYITPYGTLISVILLGVSIEKYGFLNAIPAAYSRLFSDVTDAILVFDHKYNLLDLNIAARKLFFPQLEIHPSTSIKDLPKVLQAAIQANDQELQLLVGEEIWYFDVKHSEILGKDGYLRSIMVTLHDINRRKQTELQLQKLIDEKEILLSEKEVLLREINHRVKNNFNLAGSLLFLESQKFQDADVRNAFEVSRDRIRTMSLLNERLYRSDTLNNLDLGSYLCSLAEDLISVQSPRDLVIEFNCNVQVVPVGPQEAIPCGLIVNELVTNSLKHAFLKNCDSKPAILLNLSRGNDGLIKLQVDDNGCGYPQSFNHEKSDSLGMRLVHMLGQDQLGGSVKLSNEQGASFKLTFFAEREES